MPASSASPGRCPHSLRAESEPTGGNRSQALRGARRDEVIADLKANPGSKAGEIASRVGILPPHANPILSNPTIRVERQGRSDLTWRVSSAALI